MNCFDDQAKMTDALNSQKFITGNYKVDCKMKLDT